MNKDYKQKKYSDDQILNYISKTYVTLDNDNIKNNNVHLKNVINNGLISLMQEESLFKDLFRSVTYAGSYFKGTKIAKPDEYDLDIVMQLPLNYKTLKVDTNHKHFGYVKVKVEANSKLPLWEKNTILNTWLDSNGYLDQERFRRWMQSVMRKAYDKLKKVKKDYELTVNNTTYILTEFATNGPSFCISVKLKDSTSHKTMDIDVVPCLEFNNVVLNNYVVVPNMIQKFNIVAKPSKEPNGNILWRLSFYEQEKQILLQKEFGKIKPIIRLMKKFRDNQNWKQIASYYIEMLFLNEIMVRKNDADFFRASQTNLFIYMLQKLQESLKLGRLPYFWNKQYNLFNSIDSLTMLNYANRLNRILIEIDKNITTNKFVIAQNILSSEELSLVKIYSKP